MEKIDILSYPIYKFVCDDQLLQDVQEHVKTLEFKSSQDNSDIFGDYVHDKLYEFFNDSVTQVKNKYYKKTVDFPIVACWANKYNTVQNMRSHTHSNGIISGLFYVSTHEKSSPTIFSMPDPWTNFYDTPYKMLSFYDNSASVTASVYPKAGTLLLFPSNMVHSVQATGSKETRYTISFNCFPSGTFFPYVTMALEVKALTVQERIKA